MVFLQLQVFALLVGDVEFNSSEVEFIDLGPGLFFSLCVHSTSSHRYVSVTVLSGSPINWVCSIDDRM